MLVTKTYTEYRNINQLPLNELGYTNPFMFENVY